MDIFLLIPFIKCKYITYITAVVEGTYMSMKFENIVERCGPVKTKPFKKSKTRKKRITIMQVIYALYIIETINLIATLVLWLHVFFLHRGGN